MLQSAEMGLFSIRARGEASARGPVGLNSATRVCLRFVSSLTREVIDRNFQFRRNVHEQISIITMGGDEEHQLAISQMRS